MPLVAETAPVLDGFCNVCSADAVAVAEVSDGTCHFEYAMVGARREVESGNSLFQQRCATAIRFAQNVDFLAVEQGVDFP